MRTIILLFYFCFQCINLEAQADSFHYTKSEQKAIDAVSALPEVKKLFQIYPDSPEHFEIMLAQSANSEIKYYWIKVGRRFTGTPDDYFEYFLADYEFYVTPKTYEVRNLDIVTNTPISLKKWRTKIKKGNHDATY